MRGEETILAGCTIQPSEEEQLLILPGTHSKHVIMQHGSIKDFNTYMTGEVFDLLGSKSLLAASVEKEIPETNHVEFFQKGVQDATTGNFLNNIFHVRTNTLLNSFDKTKNYMYLSGLVIGEELKHIEKDKYQSVNLVSSGALMELYGNAFAAIGLEPKLSVIDAEKALIEGQAIILEHI
jgi:2-dehydro-3-deoxygalactonokinase